jgi:hypothetical protein
LARARADGQAGYSPGSLSGKGKQQGMRKSNEVEGSDDDAEDPVERFLGLVSWGNVRKPDGWDLEPGATEDAEEDSEDQQASIGNDDIPGAVDDLEEVVRAAKALQIGR